MKNNASVVYALLLVVGDFVALLAAFSVAYILRVKLDSRPLIEQIPALTFLWSFVTILPIWLAIHGFIGLYSPSVYNRRLSELGRLAVGSLLGILVVIGYNFVTDGQLIPARLVAVYGWLIGFIFLVSLRNLARFIRQTLYLFGIGISNVIIVGDTPISIDIANSLANTAQTGQRVLALISTNGGVFKTYPNFEAAIAALRRPIHAIIQTELYRDQAQNNKILEYAQGHHVAYRFVPGNSDLFVGNIAVELFADRPMIAVHQTALIGWGRIAKRIFDLAVTLLLIVPDLGIMALIWLFVRLFDGPDVIFKQIRLTRYDRQFKVFKFRTIKNRYSGMSPEKAFELMGRSELSTKYRRNGDYLADDPRFSIVGRFLRRTSLDELPQLINVLRGDLSLVGPRALVPEELAAFDKKQAILSVKAGLTGLAQISGRRNISFEKRRQLDVYYVQNWSFWMDITIIIKTVWTVLTGAGAK